MEPMLLSSLILLGNPEASSAAPLDPPSGEAKQELAVF